MIATSSLINNKISLDFKKILVRMDNDIKINGSDNASVFDDYLSFLRNTIYVNTYTVFNKDVDIISLICNDINGGLEEPGISVNSGTIKSTLIHSPSITSIFVDVIDTFNTSNITINVSDKTSIITKHIAEITKKNNSFNISELYLDDNYKIYFSDNNIYLDNFQMNTTSITSSIIEYKKNIYGNLYFNIITVDSVYSNNILSNAVNVTNITTNNCIVSDKLISTTVNTKSINCDADDSHSNIVNVKLQSQLIDTNTLNNSNELSISLLNNTNRIIANNYSGNDLLQCENLETNNFINQNNINLNLLQTQDTSCVDLYIRDTLTVNERLVTEFDIDIHNIYYTNFKVSKDSIFPASKINESIEFVLDEINVKKIMYLHIFIDSDKTFNIIVKNKIKNTLIINTSFSRNASIRIIPLETNFIILFNDSYQIYKNNIYLTFNQNDNNLLFDHKSIIYNLNLLSDFIITANSMKIDNVDINEFIDQKVYKNSEITRRINTDTINFRNLKLLQNLDITEDIIVHNKDFKNIKNKIIFIDERNVDYLLTNKFTYDKNLKTNNIDYTDFNITNNDNNKNLLDYIISDSLSIKVLNENNFQHVIVSNNMELINDYSKHIYNKIDDNLKNTNILLLNRPVICRDIFPQNIVFSNNNNINDFNNVFTILTDSLTHINNVVKNGNLIKALSVNSIDVLFDQFLLDSNVYNLNNNSKNINIESQNITFGNVNTINLNYPIMDAINVFNQNYNFKIDNFNTIINNADLILVDLDFQTINIGTKTFNSNVFVYLLDVNENNDSTKINKIYIDSIQDVDLGDLFVKFYNSTVENESSILNVQNHLFDNLKLIKNIEPISDSLSALDIAIDFNDQSKFLIYKNNKTLSDFDEFDNINFGIINNINNIATERNATNNVLFNNVEHDTDNGIAWLVNPSKDNNTGINPCVIVSGLNLSRYYQTGFTISYLLKVQSGNVSDVLAPLAIISDNTGLDQARGKFLLKIQNDEIMFPFYLNHNDVTDSSEVYYPHNINYNDFVYDFNTLKTEENSMDNPFIDGIKYTEFDNNNRLFSETDDIYMISHIFKFNKYIDNVSSLNYQQQYQDGLPSVQLYIRNIKNKYSNITKSLSTLTPNPSQVKYNSNLSHTPYDISSFFNNCIIQFGTNFDGFVIDSDSNIDADEWQNNSIDTGSMLKLKSKMAKFRIFNKAMTQEELDNTNIVSDSDNTNII